MRQFFRKTNFLVLDIFLLLKVVQAMCYGSRRVVLYNK
jgi:hypothetical protein